MSGTASVPGWWVEFQAAVLRQLPRPGDIDQVTAEGWSRNQKALKRVLAQTLLPSKASQPKSTSLILELVSTILVSATTGKFVAKEKFVRGTGRKAKVKINYLAENFALWFLLGDGKTEDLITEQTLRYHQLRKPSADSSIIVELGGEAKAESTLTEMFSLLQKQSNGENGALLNNGYANIFYIKDSAGEFRTVFLCWNDGGWEVYADPVEDPHEWVDGCQVFSRLSGTS